MGIEVVIRLVLAMLVGGAIGLEREKSNRPAGFRTHTLVCVGSALVFLTSEFVFEKYHGLVNIDPTRLPAQIISGIGFLGAGAIIHYGSHIKGLTSAATLWVVACIGLAIGAGFYWGVIATTIIVYATLILLKRLEKNLFKTIGTVEVGVEIQDSPGQIGRVTQLMGGLGIQIKDISIEPSEEGWIYMNFLINLPAGMGRKTLLEELSQIEGVLINWEDGTNDT
ncbi:MAG TPA: MgtC/SapB family protein [Clostridia bacterium]|nr:MgtC/SapB family protein [Clostridia bacterium]